jgi:predicted glycoside hydrolase/deacetylase ChbG (UPF0249 family)
MLIVNADDWGRSRAETNAALECYQHGRITSVSAMVFMNDSERAAEIAHKHNLDAGLHLNFTDPFTNRIPAPLEGCHHGTARFLGRSKYAQLTYHPLLRGDFSYSYKAQAAEFERLFGKPPSHIDGHHHMHLCANLLIDDVIPKGSKVRRNFSFWPGEKSQLNRAYRALIDWWLARKYRLTDYFFDLTQCIQENKLGRVATLATSDDVELMTHPITPGEQAYLMSDQCAEFLQHLQLGSYGADDCAPAAFCPLPSVL